MYGDNILKTETYFHEKKPLSVFPRLSLSLSLSLSIQYNVRPTVYVMLLNEVTQYIYVFCEIIKKFTGTI